MLAYSTVAFVAIAAIFICYICCRKKRTPTARFQKLREDGEDAEFEMERFPVPTQIGDVQFTIGGEDDSPPPSRIAGLGQE